MGKVEDDNNVASVMVNGVKAKVTNDGEFWATIPLDYGENQVKVEALDALGNGSLKSFVVDRKMSVEAPAFIAGVQNSVNWESPRKIGETTSDDELMIQACIQTSDTIEKVNVLVNGWKIIGLGKEEIESIGNCKYHISHKTTLQLDANRIRIEVITNRTSFEDETEIIYSNITPVYRALLIGNEDYQDPLFNKLGEPISDA
jgi:hypothetical protein